MTLMGSATLSHGFEATIIDETVPPDAIGIETRAVVTEGGDVTISYRHDGVLASAYDDEHLHETRLDAVDEIGVSVSNAADKPCNVAVYAEWLQDEE